MNPAHAPPVLEPLHALMQALQQVKYLKDHVDGDEDDSEVYDGETDALVSNRLHLVSPLEQDHHMVHNQEHDEFVEPLNVVLA